MKLLNLNILAFVFLSNIFFTSCKKNISTITDCVALQSNTNWATENFKSGYSIQFSSDYEGVGMAGFEGNIFTKSRKDKKVALSYSFCGPLSCDDFGKDLADSNAPSISITDSNNQQISLNKKINFCDNTTVIGVYYYSSQANVTGKLFWKQDNSFKEALTIEYESSFEAEVEAILKTIKKK